MDIQAFIDRVHQLFLDSEHEQALEDVHLFLSENSHTLRKKDLALILRLNGRAYERTLNFKYALKHYSQALAIFQKIGLPDEIIKTMMRIGWVYMFKQGNLPKSLKYYNLILELVEGRHTFFHAEVLLFIGNILTEQGKMDQAGRYLTDSLKLCEEGRDRGESFEIEFNFFGWENEIGSRYKDLGIFYAKQNDYDNATKYLEQCIEISKEFNHPTNLVFSLYQFFIFHIENGERALAKRRLDQIESAADQYPAHPIPTDTFNLCNAIYLKSGNRFRDKVVAQDLFQQYIQGSTHYYKFNIEAMRHYAELLIEELQLGEDDKTKDEIFVIINKLKQVSVDYHAYPTLVDTLILESKFDLLDGNYDQSLQLLNEALQITQEQGLFRLTKIVQAETEALRSDFERLNNLINNNVSTATKLESLQLIKYLNFSRSMVSEEQ